MPASPPPPPEVVYINDPTDPDVIFGLMREEEEEKKKAELKGKDGKPKEGGDAAAAEAAAAAADPIAAKLASAYPKINPDGSVSPPKMPKASVGEALLKELYGKEPPHLIGAAAPPSYDYVQPVNPYYGSAPPPKYPPSYG